MKQNTSHTLIITAVFLLAAALLRIINAETGWYHFTPIVAMSIFSGALLKRKPLAFALPLLAYLLTDIYMQIVHHNGFYGISQSFVYGAMLLVVLMGSFMKKKNILNIAGFSIGGTLLFWLISNLGVFVAGYYGISWEGLTTTYIMALPFYHNEMATTLFTNALVGDLVFSGVFFGCYALLSRSKQVSGQLAK